MLTHETLHLKKCFPNIRCAIFQKQITNRLHTTFSYGMIQMADKKSATWLPLRTLILCFFSQVAKNVLVTTFLVNHNFSSKYMFRCYYPAGKYRSLERPEEVPSNVPRTYPKHPIWPSRGRYHLTFWGSPNLTSQGRPESTSRGCILVGVFRHSQYLQKTS